MSEGEKPVALRTRSYTTNREKQNTASDELKSSSSKPTPKPTPSATQKGTVPKQAVPEAQNSDTDLIQEVEVNSDAEYDFNYYMKEQLKFFDESGFVPFKIWHLYTNLYTNRPYKFDMSLEKETKNGILRQLEKIMDLYERLNLNKTQMFSIQLKGTKNWDNEFLTYLKTQYNLKSRPVMKELVRIYDLGSRSDKVTIGTEKYREAREGSLFKFLNKENPLQAIVGAEIIPSFRFFFAIGDDKTANSKLKSFFLNVPFYWNLPKNSSKRSKTLLWFVVASIYFRVKHLMTDKKYFGGEDKKIFYYLRSLEQDDNFKGPINFFGKFVRNPRVSKQYF